MREFFRGWHQKMGCVTLVMACVLMGAWARSFAVRDQIITLPQFGYGQMLTSEAGHLEWVTWKANYPTSYIPAEWRSQQLPDTKLGKVRLFRRVKATMVGVSLAGPKIEGFAVPHWLIAGPLAVLSAGLILWKPRQGSQVPE